MAWKDDLDIVLYTPGIQVIL